MDLYPSMSASRPNRAPRLAATVAALVCFGILCMLLVLIALSMRTVMEIGGMCASGNSPYVIQTPCPKGTTAALGGGIPVALFALFGYLGFGFRIGAVAVAPLAWPALFGLLGWNFLDYAFHPPGSTDTPVVGWLICGIVFWLMAAPPLAVMIVLFVRRKPPTVGGTTVGGRLAARAGLSGGVAAAHVLVATGAVYAAFAAHRALT